MNPLVDYILHLIYPPKCMFCGKLLKNADDVYCSDCYESLPDFDGPDRKISGFAQVLATFSYEGGVRRSIHNLKFAGLRDNAVVLGAWMAGTVRDKVKKPVDYVSWVPCSNARRWKRGYDQAECLARVVAAELGISCICTLRKKKNNKPQSSLRGGASRRANVMGVYEPVCPEVWQGKRVLLIDDVLTTGSTLAECGKVLRRYGVASLVCAVVASVGHD